MSKCPYMCVVSLRQRGSSTRGRPLLYRDTTAATMCSRSSGTPPWQRYSVCIVGFQWTAFDRFFIPDMYKYFISPFPKHKIRFYILVLLSSMKMFWILKMLTAKPLSCCITIQMIQSFYNICVKVILLTCCNKDAWRKYFLNTSVVHGHIQQNIVLFKSPPHKLYTHYNLVRHFSTLYTINIFHCFVPSGNYPISLPTARF